MPTTVTKTIGSGGGRDYSTIQAWEDASPADLTSVDQIWRGECYNDSEFSAGVTISGTTVDSTRFAVLTAAAGQSFQDNANVRTNALRYNQANGVGISKTGDFNFGVSNGQQYTQISRLQVRTTGQAAVTLTTGNVTNVKVDDCVLEGQAAAGGYVLGAAGGTIRNCLAIATNAACEVVSAGDFSNGWTLHHCTIVKGSTTPGAGGTALKGGACSAKPDIYNTAVFGFTNLVNSASRFNDFKYCATDLADPTGWSGVTTGSLFSKTFANQFQSTTDSSNGNGDFRTKDGADLTDAGNGAVSGTPANDISGFARSSPDIGAWERDQTPVFGSLGQFDKDMRSESMFDTGEVAEGWFDKDLIDAVTPSLSLQGDAQDVVTAAGGLATQIQLAGAALVVATANGALTTEIRVAGSMAAVATMNGDLLTEIRLSGNAIAQALMQAGLTTDIKLAGAAQAVATMQGNLTTQIKLAGDALSVVTMTGDLTAPGSSLSGAMQAVAGATGILTTEIRMVGNAVALAGMSGLLSTEIRPAGAAQDTATMAAGITAQIKLAGAAASVTTMDGALTVQTSFTGAALAQALMAGGLTTIIRLSGSDLVQVTMNGTLEQPTPPVVDPRYRALAAGRRWQGRSAGRRWHAGRLVS